MKRFSIALILCSFLGGFSLPSADAQTIRAEKKAVPARPAVGSMKALKAPGGNPRFECVDYKCTCSGAYDCVQMVSGTSVCKDGTVQCNEDGCVCDMP